MGFRPLLIVLSFFLSLPSIAAEKFRIVSDVDDTIKITNVDEIADAVWNGLFTKHAFAGMGRLYAELTAAHPGTEIHYLSAANELLRPNIRRFLDVNGFPTGEITLKRVFENRDTAAYKIEKLEELFAQYPDDRFILIGDDTQADPHAYYTLFMKYPERVAEIYIRSVRGVRLPSGVYGFTTAFDIARAEFDFGRFDFPSVEGIAQAILDETRNRRILPPFHACPRTSRAFEQPIEELARLVDTRIQAICGERTGDPNEDPEDPNLGRALFAFGVE